jgi:hypothetical protein
VISEFSRIVRLLNSPAIVAVKATEEVRHFPHLHVRMSAELFVLLTFDKRVPSIMAATVGAPKLRG